VGGPLDTCKVAATVLMLNVILSLVATSASQFQSICCTPRFSCIVAILTVLFLYRYFESTCSWHVKCWRTSSKQSSSTTSTASRDAIIMGPISSETSVQSCTQLEVQPANRFVQGWSACWVGCTCLGGLRTKSGTADARRNRKSSSHILQAPLLPGMDRSIQISGLSTMDFSKWPSESQQAVVELRRKLASDQDFQRHEAFGCCKDADLVRFILAQKHDVVAAEVMFRQALRWRNRRMPYWLVSDPWSDVAQALEMQARTGKGFARGQDVFGRGLLMLDNTVENSTDAAEVMRFLAYNVQAALFNCARGVDKLCVTINLENFSMYNVPPFGVTRETLEILQVAFPETLGTVVLWQPPRYFKSFFAMVRPLIDPRTRSKITFVIGDTQLGSENDGIMCGIFGTDWREVTGLGLPRAEHSYSNWFKRDIPCARGYCHATEWQRALDRDSHRALSSACPPWHLTKEEALDETWDGSYPEFWSASLKKPIDKQRNSHGN